MGTPFDIAADRISRRYLAMYLVWTEMRRCRENGSCAPSHGTGRRRGDGNPPCWLVRRQRAPCQLRSRPRTFCSSGSRRESMTHLPTPSGTHPISQSYVIGIPEKTKVGFRIEVSAEISHSMSPYCLCTRTFVPRAPDASQTDIYKHGQRRRLIICTTFPPIASLCRRRSSTRAVETVYEQRSPPETRRRRGKCMKEARSKYKTLAQSHVRNNLRLRIRISGQFLHGSHQWRPDVFRGY